MTTTPHSIRWNVVTESVIGWSHSRAGTLNQDAVLAEKWSVGGAEFLVLAVADGHGSEKCPYSHLGASFAVEVAVEIGKEFLAKKFLNLSQAKQAAENWLVRRIVERWREKVQDHLKSQCTFFGESNGNDDANDSTTVSDPKLNYIEYGTTLLAVILGFEQESKSNFIICLQIGDGEVVEVNSHSGKATRLVPRDDEHVANVTDSLSQENAAKRFRICFRVYSGELPGLILLTTDGYPNSFESTEEFMSAGSDLLSISRSGGVEQIQNNLKSWLEEATRLGSGDDCTLGLVVRDGFGSPKYDSATTSVEGENVHQSDNSISIQPLKTGYE